MNQTKIIGIVLIVVAAILLYFGMNASNAPAEQLAEAFTGQYSDRTMMYFFGAGITGVLGILALVKK